MSREYDVKFRFETEVDIEVQADSADQALELARRELDDGGTEWLPEMWPEDFVFVSMERGDGWTTEGYESDDVTHEVTTTSDVAELNAITLAARELVERIEVIRKKQANNKKGQS